MEFHIWDLERVNIKLRLEFLKEISKRIFEKYKTLNCAYEKIFLNRLVPFATFKNTLKESNQRYFFVPLDILLKICEGVGLNREELEKNIVAYKTAGGINYVENPILPIKINPIFDMILAHNIGDGTVINPKNGRLPYFGYRQFDEFYRVSYIRKIEEIFGKIKFKEGDYFEKSTRPYCPSVLSSLFFRYYNLKIEDFLSDRARIPEVVFENKESMLAFLIGMIIDEGHVDSVTIIINLKNKLLIYDLEKICNILGYKSVVRQAKSEVAKGYWRLYLLRVGLEKFWKDYLELNQKYKIIDLGWKGDQIKNSFKINQREIKRIKGNSDLILNILKNEQLSVNQLAERLNMTRQGMRYHIHNLLNNKQIRIIDKTQLNWTYGI